MSQFVEGIAPQFFEAFGRFHNKDSARARNAKEPAIDTHRRSKKRSDPAPDAFLPTNVTRRRMHAGHDAAVAPEKKQATE